MPQAQWHHVVDASMSALGRVRQYGLFPRGRLIGSNGKFEWRDVGIAPAGDSKG
jgi:hypothetical protein